LALPALALGLTLPATAQNGTNYEVKSNGIDAVFLGVGAGATQVAGADGIGWWVDGCDLVGNSMTALGDHGYKQVTFGISACVLGPPPAIRLDFPLILVIEYDHFNLGNPAIFIRPTCLPGGIPAGVTTGGAVPFGLAPGTSANFLISGLPSGIGAPSSTVVIIPEQGLLNHTATATIIAAGSGNLMINSTGFCWVVTFTWLPTALLGVDHIDGWWYWMINSRNGNQYWGVSTDEMNLLQTRTVGSDAGVTALYTFVSSADYEFHDSTQTSSVNDSLHPGGHNGVGTYYTTALQPTCSTVAAVIPNGGFDMGRHLGWSFSGVGGSTDNPVTGLSNQNPAGAALPLPFGVTLGFTSWNNQDYPLLNNPPPVAGVDTGGTRVVWLQVAWHRVLRLPTLESTNPTAIGGFGVRVPCGVEFLGPDPWPQTVTISNLLTWAHDTCDATGDPAWPDPWGFPGGAFGIPPVVGTSNIHAPLPPLVFCIFGVKVMFCYGTIGTVGTTAPNAFFKPGFQGLTFNPGVASVGNSHCRIAYD
jgi:hypothetical protein